MLNQVEMEVDMSGSDAQESAIVDGKNIFECLSKYFNPHWIVTKVNTDIGFGNFIRTIVTCISTSSEPFNSDVYKELCYRNRILTIKRDIVSEPDYPLYIGKVKEDIHSINCRCSINPISNKNSLIKKVLKRSIEIEE